MHKKILFAVGGTGGHLFPAQALARELKQQSGEVEILFAGGGLGSNPFFHKLQFPFREIASSSPFRYGLFRSIFRIAKGMVQSLSLVREFQPDYILGFGSFYSFPLLAIARVRKIPYILVEANAHPGKVNRLFSAKAHLSALQFPIAAKQMRGKTCQVRIPKWSQELEETHIDCRQARKYFKLDPDRLTLLVFGGSQGARTINEAMVGISIDQPFQVLHICGKEQEVSQFQSRWKEKNIQAHVVAFEPKMHLAWHAADFAICRAGAGTCMEILDFAVPSLLIPWKGATEDHQTKNAQYLVQRKAACMLEEHNLEKLSCAIDGLIASGKELQETLLEMQKENIPDLTSLVMQEAP